MQLAPALPHTSSSVPATHEPFEKQPLHACDCPPPPVGNGNNGNSPASGLG